MFTNERDDNRRCNEWRELHPLLPVAQGIGRPRTHSLQDVIDGIRYVQRYGVWPRSLVVRVMREPGRVVCPGFADGLVGREASPALAIIDAQSVKCDAPQDERSYDAGEKTDYETLLHVSAGAMLFASIGRLLASMTMG